MLVATSMAAALDLKGAYGRDADVVLKAIDMIGPSRLSDIALEWMVGELKACIPSIIVREELLVTTPDSLGLQHDEAWMVDRWYYRKRWKRHPRLVEAEFRLHPTVVERLEAPTVPDLECSRPYRPPQLAEHPQATDFFT